MKVESGKRYETTRSVLFPNQKIYEKYLLYQERMIYLHPLLLYIGVIYFIPVIFIELKKRKENTKFI